MQLTVPPIKYREIFSSQLLLKFLQVTYLLLPFNLRLHLSININGRELKGSMNVVSSIPKIFSTAS